MCKATGDIINLYGKINGISDFPEVLDRLQAKYGIIPDFNPKTDKNYTRLFEVAENHLHETDYLTKRGISLQTQRNFHCGYISEFVYKNNQVTPAVIIPTSETSFMWRSTVENVKQKRGTARIFTPFALNSPYCFVVEGEIDCLSLVEAILQVDLYGTAILLEEVGKVIAKGGVGVTISSQSGWRMPQLTAEQDYQLAMTPAEELLNLEILRPENIRDTLHAYQLAKRCNEKRVMSESVKWGERGARINAVAPGIIVTPLAIDEFNGIRGDFYKNMFAKCPAGRAGTADEVANVAELLMNDKSAFITGSTFLIDGGATASYYYGLLKPTE